MLEDIAALESRRPLKRRVILQMAPIQQGCSVYRAAGGRIGHGTGVERLELYNSLHSKFSKLD